jgi:N-methylhydantoinase A/oxoprolinase/acetone carboxylase beta subunit
VRRIGIDVGGTNTDAVLLDGMRVVAAAKLPTTADLDEGVVAAVRAVLDVVGPDAPPVDAVMIGTTQFTNAVVERARLERVAAIRIGLPASASLPPTVDWPADLKAVVDPMVFMVEGGHEYDGRPLVPLDRPAVRSAARRIAEAGITSVAISAIFSPLTSEAELEAAAIVAEEAPRTAITCSSDLGRIGLLERENVALLNAALRGLGRRTVAAFEAALAGAGLDVPTFLTQNDGTVVRAQVAAEAPVQSFASGPTNSMRGAAAMSGLADAVVVDVGGTTSDIGHLRGGFPRQANSVIEVGGVRTLFRMPDLVPIGLGGGSVVDEHTGAVGPRSVGYRITEEALVFGGSTTTATDVAVAAGLVEVGDAGAVAHLDASDVARHLATMRAMVQGAVDRSRTAAGDLDLIAVGGGAFLVPDHLDGISKVHRVEHAGVANAVGAAMAQVSGDVDQVFSGTERTAAIDAALALAVQRAEAAGAEPATIEVVEVEDLPLAYVPGGARRVRARVVGDVALVPHDRVNPDGTAVAPR